mgnify:CR=1 FL=1
MLIDENDYLKLKQQVKDIETAIGGYDFDFKRSLRTYLAENTRVQEQSLCAFGLHTALCVNTKDIWKQNRIQFYTPRLAKPNTPIENLPWANAVSNMGGFDDCGLTWVPPAGSTVIIFFEQGNRQAPFYLGTTWHRNRGPVGEHNWYYSNMKEYDDIWEGRRKGYLTTNDESIVMPPWNTENYNGFDLDDNKSIDEQRESQRNITYPNIYGIKTPEKHMIKMVDGDPKCNRKWKRFEIMSSRGNWFMMKDDHLHYAGQWANPKCGGNIIDGETSCDAGYRKDKEYDGETYEENFCINGKSNKKIIGGHPNTGHINTKYTDQLAGSRSQIGLSLIHISEPTRRSNHVN